MNQRVAYREWSQTHPELPIFMRDWWLDAVCIGKEWTAIRLPSGEMMPFLLRKRVGMSYVVMPQETQIAGCFGKQDSAKDVDRAIQNLHLAYYYQKFPIGSVLPVQLQNLGYTIREMTTYRIENLTDTDALMKRYSENKRRQIKKAASLTIDMEVAKDEFYLFHLRNLKQQGKTISYRKDFFDSLYDACEAHHAGQIIGLRNLEGQLAAAVFLVFDEQTCYYLIPTFDPQQTATGASARIAHEAILFAAKHSRTFDFEGSIVPGIANHYRQFGSTPTTYYAVEQCFNPLFNILLLGNRLRTWKKK